MPLDPADSNLVEALDQLVDALQAEDGQARTVLLTARPELAEYAECLVRLDALLPASAVAGAEHSDPLHTGPTGPSENDGDRVGTRFGRYELVERIGHSRVRLGTPVTRINRTTTDANGKPWQVHMPDGSVLRADGVILACPTHRAAVMLKGSDDQLACQLESVPYSSSAIVYFGYRRDEIGHPLDAFGFVAPHLERRHIMACSFSSVKYAGRAPEGHTLLRAFLGGALQPHVLDGDDAEVIAAARHDLDELLHISGKPIFASLHRWHKAMAQYRVGHLDRIAQIRDRVAQHPGLDVAGNGFEGVGIPDCVRDGERAAERMMTGIAAKRRTTPA